LVPGTSYFVLCTKPVSGITTQSLFLLFARKGAKTQRNLTANGSNLLLLGSCLLLLLLDTLTYVDSRMMKWKVPGT